MRRSGGHRSHGGFTLIELVIVLAIIGVLATIAVLALRRGQDKTSIMTAARNFQARVSYARTLAENAGPRLVGNGLTLGAGCDAAWTMIGVTVDPTTQSYIVPARIDYNAATDAMTVQCETYDFAAGTRVEESKVRDKGGQLVTRGVAPGALFRIVFTNLGRIDVANSTPTDATFYAARIQRTLDTTDANAMDGYGFRILPSGIVCRADVAATMNCQEDLF